MYQKPSSTVDVARAFGVTAETIRARLIEWGVPRHPAKNLPRPQPNKARKMSQNGFWRGGEIVDANGYLRRKINEHPDANSNGYVLVHRLVMEKKLGRALIDCEVVHHVDGNKRNNAPENLELFSHNAEHLRTTLKGRCPQWTEEGRKRTLRGHLAWRRRCASIREKIEAYAHALGLSYRFLMSQLTQEGRDLLRKALTQGEILPLHELAKAHGKRLDPNAPRKNDMTRLWDRICA